MSDTRPERFHRADARRRTHQELARRRRREPGGGFWRGIALIGSVGWPIALMAIGSALLGRWLDHRSGTGIRITLMLLFAGTSFGTWIAFRAVRGAR